ncbi:MAG TPA: hypothetical protein VMU53_11915 [Candidatus Sulfotelmatobacter sp.]|nr:hypothetical protein [Candidatus Sulfotelmatobacter sp.]
MSQFRPQAPWEFLLSASRTTLQSYELSRLAHAANLRKEIGELLDQYMEESTSAMLARWLIEQRERSVLSATIPETPDLAASSNGNGNGASDNVLADQIPLPRTPRRRS